MTRNSQSTGFGASFFNFFRWIGQSLSRLFFGAQKKPEPVDMPGTQTDLNPGTPSKDQLTYVSFKEQCGGRDPSFSPQSRTDERTATPEKPPWFGGNSWFARCFKNQHPETPSEWNKIRHSGQSTHGDKIPSPPSFTDLSQVDTDNTATFHH